MTKSSTFATAVLTSIQFLLPESAGADPRPPQPPWPEAPLQRLDFDEPAATASEAATASGLAGMDYAESWSGWALRRDGLAVSPTIISGVGSGGRQNLNGENGALRFWFSPTWSSTTAGGKGPGCFARLLELVLADAKSGSVLWSLYVSADGAATYLSAQFKAEAADVLKVEIPWEAGRWYCLALNYGPKGTQLLLDGEMAAEGPSIPEFNTALAGLVVGSDWTGGNLAGGSFDEVATFAKPLLAEDFTFYFIGTIGQVALGAISPEEAQAREELRAKRRAEREAAEAEAAMMRAAWSEPANPCVTNGPVYLTNIVAVFDTNQGWMVAFDIAGGTNGVPYDIFTTTNLLGSNALDTAWEWLDLGYTCYRYTFTNQPDAQAFYMLVLSDVDQDGDGLPDWWELQHGLDPNNPDTGNTGVSDGYKDPDGDSWTNLQEYQNGTDPNSFHTPPAPTGLQVSMGSNGVSATVRWSPSSGPVTGYTIERSFTNQAIQVSSSIGQVTDGAATIPTWLYQESEAPQYRLRAEYSGGSSAWTSWTMPPECRAPDVQTVSGVPGQVFLAASDLADAVVLGVGIRVSDGYHQVAATNFDLAIVSFTNGLAEAPAGYAAAVAGAQTFAQLVRSNGVPSAMRPAGGAWTSFYDARTNLRENLRFLLRSATVTLPFSYVSSVTNLDSISELLERPASPAGYEYSGFHTYISWSDSVRSYPLRPVQENFLWRNYTFNSGDVTNGTFTTGAEWDYWEAVRTLDEPKYYYPGNGTETPLPVGLLSTNFVWAMSLWCWDDDEDLLADLGLFLVPNPPGKDNLFLANNVRNLYGLSVNNVLFRSSSGLYTNVVPGGAGIRVPVWSYFFVGVTEPALQTVGYYFTSPTPYLWQTPDYPAQPGTPNFSVTNLSPMLIAPIGQQYRVSGWAKQAILNGYTNKFAYLEQYFDKAYRMTNDVATTNQTGILSPYGEFFPTEPGPTALVTMPDLDTGGRGTAVVNVVKLQLDVNHDGVMDLSFAGPDNTSQVKPFTFWINNDYDRYFEWGDGSVDPDDDVTKTTRGMFYEYQRVTDSEYRYVGYYGATPIRRIPSLRDVEDFARLWICGVTTNLLPSLPAGTVVALSWGDKGNPNPDNPTIDLFKAADTNGYWAPYGSYGYLTNITSAMLQTNHLLYVTNLGPGDSIEGSVTNFLDMQRLIWCGVKAGAGKLTLTFRQGTNTIAETSTYIEIKAIKQMYERWTVGDVPSTSTAPTNKPYLATEELPVGTPAFQYAASGDTNTPYILLVHDYDLPTWKKDRYAETAFKRLYWQGYEGRFGLFRWPGVQNSSRPLDDSEFNAWRSSAGLLNLLTNLNAKYQGNVFLMAHGYGAIMAGEALRQAGTNELVNTYIAMQGAVAAHAYDPSAPLRRPPPFETPDFYSVYHANNAPYFWPFGGATTYINYFNTNDSVLTNLWRNTQETKPDLGYHWNGTNFSSGFIPPYSLLLFPVDRYEIFAYCDEARSEAIGAQPNLSGPFFGQPSLNLSTLPAPVRGIGSDHSGQFKSFCADTWAFWRVVLISMGLKSEDGP